MHNRIHVPADSKGIGSRWDDLRSSVSHIPPIHEKITNTERNHREEKHSLRKSKKTPLKFGRYKYPQNKFFPCSNTFSTQRPETREVIQCPVSHSSVNATING